MKDIISRVFIVGCPRSGTTLLQGMLAAHPRIKSFPETHFFSIAFPKTRLKRLVTWPALNTQGILENFLQEINRPELIPEVNISLFDKQYEKSFIRILDLLTLEAGKDIWVEKTPRHIYFISEIQERVPRAKFIHIVRNGADVVASLYEATTMDFSKWRKGKPSFSRGLSITQCIERWNKSVKITESWQNQPNQLVVKYEELIETPVDILEKICSFMDIKYSNLMIKAEASYGEIVTSNEEWKANNLKPIRNTNQRKFDQLFSEKQKKHIIKKLVQTDL